MVSPQEALQVVLEVTPGMPGTTLQVSSAEDTVLQKLLWYKKGNCVSGQQLNDVLGVLKVQGARLDLHYLAEWARRIGVEDLLRQAFKDSGLDPGRI